MPESKKPKPEVQKILSIAGDKINSDSEYMAALEEDMSVPDRLEFNDIKEGISICKKTGKLSEYSKLLARRSDLVAKYESDNDDSIDVCFDDYAIAEASGA